MSHNLTTAVVENLRARIVEGRIVPRERLPGGNNPIAEHGVGRTVVREAARTGASGDAAERG